MGDAERVGLAAVASWIDGGGDSEMLGVERPEGGPRNLPGLEVESPR